jgi:hypothetical protein
MPPTQTAVPDPRTAQDEAGRSQSGLILPPTTDLAHSTDFKVATAAVRVVDEITRKALSDQGIELTDDGLPIVHGVGSSNIVDLDGDTMELSALQDMANVDPSTTIFVNHSYSVPEDVVGKLAARPVIRQQGPLADLLLAIGMVLVTDRAQKLYQQIQAGIRMGISVGGAVTDYDFDTMDRLHVLHLLTLEWSFCGIPANQRSWVESAAKGLLRRSILEGRYDQRLAALVRSLYDQKRYDEMVQLAETVDPTLAKHLAATPARTRTDPRRIVFRPPENVFKLLGQQGGERVLDARELGAILPQPVMLVRKSVTLAEPTAPAAEPVAPETAPEIAPETAEPMAVETSPQADLGVDLEVTKAASEEDHQAQQERSAKYGIAIKETNSNVNKPKRFADVPDSHWGDPVNYRYPMQDKEHADVAAARFGDPANRSDYTSKEQNIVAGRIMDVQREYGEDPVWWDEEKSSQQAEKSGEAEITTEVTSEITAQVEQPQEPSEPVVPLVPVVPVVPAGLTLDLETTKALGSEVYTSAAGEWWVRSEQGTFTLFMSASDRATYSQNTTQNTAATATTVATTVTTKDAATVLDTAAGAPLVRQNLTEQEHTDMDPETSPTTDSATDPATETDLIDKARIPVSVDGSHEAFTGTHTHAHAAYGVQGGDQTHEHEHSHDGDSHHGHHDAVEASVDSLVEAPPEPGTEESAQTDTEGQESALGVEKGQDTLETTEPGTTLASTAQQGTEQIVKGLGCCKSEECGCGHDCATCAAGECSGEVCICKTAQAPQDLETVTPTTTQVAAVVMSDMQAEIDEKLAQARATLLTSYRQMGEQLRALGASDEDLGITASQIGETVTLSKGYVPDLNALMLQALMADQAIDCASWSVMDADCYMDGILCMLGIPDYDEEQGQDSPADSSGSHAIPEMVMYGAGATLDTATLKTYSAIRAAKGKLTREQRTALTTQVADRAPSMLLRTVANLQGLLTLVTKAGREFSTENMVALQLLHDTLAKMTENKVCAVYQAPAEGTQGDPAQGGSGKPRATLNPPESPDLMAQLEAALAQNSTAQIETTKAVGIASDTLAKKLEQMAGTLDVLKAAQQEQATISKGIELARADLANLHKQTQDLEGDLNALRNMPLGNPIHVNRQLAADPAAAGVRDLLHADPVFAKALDAAQVAVAQQAQRAVTVTEEETLESALAKTSKVKIPDFGPYREWPAGVGKGIRPALTDKHKGLMHDWDVYQYEHGGYARVPILVGDPQ